MFFITKPREDEILRFLEREPESPLSYAPVGICAAPPPGFDHDVERACIGHGEEVFLSACSALRSWQMFDLSWAWLYPRDAGTAVGTGIVMGTGTLVGAGKGVGVATTITSFITSFMTSTSFTTTIGTAVGTKGADVGVGVGLTTASGPLPLPDGGTKTGTLWLPFPDPAATATRVPTAANSATTPTAASIQDLLRLLPVADWTGVPTMVAPAGGITTPTGCRPAAWGTVSCRAANACASSLAD